MKIYIKAVVLETLEVDNHNLQEYNEMCCDNCFNLADKQEYDACLESYMNDYKDGMEHYAYSFDEFEWEVDKDEQ